MHKILDLIAVKAAQMTGKPIQDFYDRAWLIVAYSVTPKTARAIIARNAKRTDDPFERYAMNDVLSMFAALRVLEAA